MGLKDFKFSEFQQQLACLTVIELYINFDIGTCVDVGHCATAETLMQNLAPHFQLFGTVNGEIPAGSWGGRDRPLWQG